VLGQSWVEGALLHYRRATNADPNFIVAQAAIAASLCLGQTHPFGYDQFTELSHAVAMAQALLARDPTLSDAHLVVAWHAFIRERDWRKASYHFRRAIATDRANTDPRAWYGLFLFSTGRTNEALATLREASRLKGSDFEVTDFLGQALVAARKYPQAVLAFQAAYDMPADSKEWQSRQLARALWWKDHTDAALARWLDALYGEDKAWLAEMKATLAANGQIACWSKRLEGLRRRSNDPLILAEGCAMAGRTEEALNFLEQAKRERHDFLVLKLKVDPEWDGLRGQGRFKQLLSELNLAE
jgi:tetratricopeptide (TPR) repeat protein